MTTEVKYESIDRVALLDPSLMEKSVDELQNNFADTAIALAIKLEISVEQTLQEALEGFQQVIESRDRLEALFIEAPTV